MRLIDADAHRQEVVTTANVQDGTLAAVIRDAILCGIDEQPTIDAIPVSWLKEHLPVTVYRDLMDAWRHET